MNSAIGGSPLPVWDKKRSLIIRVPPRFEIIYFYYILFLSKRGKGNFARLGIPVPVFMCICEVAQGKWPSAKGKVRRIQLQGAANDVFGGFAAG